MSIHDDILTPLSCTRELVVRPKQSTIQFTDSRQSISDIARTLHVEYVLETAVKGIEDELRLDVRLVEVEPEERYIWTRSFKTSWEEIAAVYPKIVNSVFNELKIGLSEEQMYLVERSESSNPEIRKLCKLGDYYMQKLTKDDFLTGLQYVQEAMDLDPTDPLPYITLTRAYSTASHIANLDPEAGNLAMAYAKKVLEADPMDLGAADAYVSLGAHALYHDWDLKLARDYLMRALDLNPNNAYAHYHYGWYLMLENDYERGMSEFERSIEIDPLNTFFTHNIAWYYIWTGEFEKAVDPARKSIDMDPDYAYGQAALGLAYAETGRYDEGIDIQLKALKINNVFEHYLGISYYRAGMIDSANMVAERIETYGGAWFSWALLELYAVLGEEEKAMENLETAYELRQDFIPWLKYNYYLRELRDNERFNEIINSIEYPD
jgi:tetratricopeptide (TPR) repeat protein